MAAKWSFEICGITVKGFEKSFTISHVVVWPGYDNADGKLLEALEIIRQAAKAEARREVRAALGINEEFPTHNQMHRHIAIAIANATATE